MEVNNETETLALKNEAESNIEKAFHKWKMWSEIAMRWNEFSPSWDGLDKCMLRRQYWHGKLAHELQSFTEI